MGTCLTYFVGSTHAQSQVFQVKQLLWIKYGGIVDHKRLSDNNYPLIMSGKYQHTWFKWTPIHQIMKTQMIHDQYSNYRHMRGDFVLDTSLHCNWRFNNI